MRGVLDETSRSAGVLMGAEFLEMAKAAARQTAS
jgi:hypothetical protein